MLCYSLISYDESTGLPFSSSCQSIYSPPTTRRANQAARLDISPKHLWIASKFRLLSQLTQHLLRRSATFMHSWRSKSRICLPIQWQRIRALPMPTTPRISRIGAEYYSPDRWKRALAIARPSMGVYACAKLASGWYYVDYMLLMRMYSPTSQQSRAREQF